MLLRIICRLLCGVFIGAALIVVAPRVAIGTPASPPSSNSSPAEPPKVDSSQIEILTKKNEPERPNLRTTLSITRLTYGLGRITGLVQYPTEPSRMLALEGNGIIDILVDGVYQRRGFLDIEDLLSKKKPDALFGLAFSRHFPVTRFGYIGYVDRQGDTVIARITSEQNDRASAESLKVELKVVQEVQHERTGALTFGEDDHLYIATGDGGGPASGSHAQIPGSPLGKILRIQVGREDYSIPPSNPFLNDPKFLPETFALGLRDPFLMLPGKDILVFDRFPESADFLQVVNAKKNFGWPSQPSSPLASYSREKGQCVGAATRLSRASQSFLLYADCVSGALFTQEILADGLLSGSASIGSVMKPVSALAMDKNGDVFAGTTEGEIYLLTGILR